jgi:hypothetical protein
MVAAVKQEPVDQSNVLFEEVPTSGDAVPMEGTAVAVAAASIDAGTAAGTVRA